MTWGHSGFFPGWITEVYYFPALDVAANDFVVDVVVTVTRCTLGAIHTDDWRTWSGRSVQP